ncbi:MAG: hypothetical protein IT350_08435 [Deltaproteobacteria bacterium]|nr:hypothetical protein [Deltaproteobacteria bacterium]
MSRIVGVGIEMVRIEGGEQEAGTHAARRALAKAMGREPDDAELPSVSFLAGGAPVAADFPENLRAHLTITHEDGRAVAVAIVEDVS